MIQMNFNANLDKNQSTKKLSLIRDQNATTCNKRFIARLLLRIYSATTKWRCI
jgi:hypothetical protein